MKLYFIVGMSRSGTTWLARSLNEHTKITAFGETCFFGRNDIGKPNYNYNDLNFLKKKHKTLDKLNQTGNLFFNALENTIKNFSNQNKIPKQRIFKDFANQISLIAGSDFIIEKTPHHINHFKKIKEFYPETKFLVCYRSPGGFLLSYKHQGDRKDRLTKINFNNSYHPFFALKVYKKFESQINEIKKNEYALIIEFNDIVNNPKILLEKVQKFLEIPIENIVYKKTNSSFENITVPTLGLEDKLWLNLICKSRIKLNYFEKFISPFIMFLSILKLIKSSFFVLYILIKTMKLKRIIPYLISYFK